MCDYVKNTQTCSDFVHFVDYLHLLFCTLNLPWDPSHIFLIALYLAVLYNILYMIVKYL